MCEGLTSPETAEDTPVESKRTGIHLILERRLVHIWLGQWLY